MVLLHLIELEAYLLKVKKNYLFLLIEPKAARCFSILGVKTLQGQKTFNVECEKEEDCIKYVDYVSMIIQNYKSTKEDVISLNAESIGSSLNNPFEKFK